jgi:hypothetical protein
MDPAEYRAKREWLRSNPYGTQAGMIKQQLRGWERELEAQGTPVEAWLESHQTRMGLSPWYVAFFHDRPGQPLASKVRHRDRDCQHLSQVSDVDLREATEEEIKRLAPCGTCG